VTAARPSTPNPTPPTHAAAAGHGTVVRHSTIPITTTAPAASPTTPYPAGSPGCGANSHPANTRLAPVTRPSRPSRHRSGHPAATPGRQAGPATDAAVRRPSPAATSGARTDAATSGSMPAGAPVASVPRANRRGTTPGRRNTNAGVARAVVGRITATTTAPATASSGVQTPATAATSNRRPISVMEAGARRSARSTVASNGGPSTKG